MLFQLSVYLKKKQKQELREDKMGLLIQKEIEIIDQNHILSSIASLVE